MIHPDMNCYPTCWHSYSFLAENILKILKLQYIHEEHDIVSVLFYHNCLIDNPITTIGSLGAKYFIYKRSNLKCDQFNYN